MTTVKSTDEQILGALKGHQIMTYMIANRLRNAKGRPDTAFVLRRLKAMEKAGRVKRVATSYKVQLCWSLVEAGGE